MAVWEAARVVGPPDAPPPFPDPVGQSAGVWTGMFRDEFTGDSVTVVDADAGQVQLSPDGPIWQCWYPDWPRFTTQSPGGNHTNTNDLSYFDLSKVSVGDGVCTLTSTHATTVAGLPYTSGMIQSLPDGQDGFAQQYGYFEARLRIPDLSDGSLWPAWWMSNAVFNDWPPEIDIFERISTGTDGYKFNVFPASGDTETNNITNSDMTGFHVYGCKWDADGVVGYLDGVQIAASSLSLHTPQYLICDLATLTGATHTTATMDIDYVRVWQ